MTGNIVYGLRIGILVTISTSNNVILTARYSGLTSAPKRPQTLYLNEVPHVILKY